MKWIDAERLIRAAVVPGKTAILKCDGIGRRTVTAHTAQKISLRTGIATKQTKTISYDMLRYAFEGLEGRGRFDSRDFRSKFAEEYDAAPCRFSMTGGVLVEVGLAQLVPGPSEKTCHYVRPSQSKGTVHQVPPKEGGVK
jgi:hypothetical protein